MSQQRSTHTLPWLGAVALITALVGAALQYWPTKTTIQWRTYDAARTEALAAGKPIYLDLYAEWCAPCKEMDRLTFPNDTVQKLLRETYIPARLNIDSEVFTDSLKQQWNIKGVPTAMILGSDGREVQRKLGFQSATDLIRWLEDSSAIQVAGWSGFPEARDKARRMDRPMLVVIAQSRESLEHLQETVGDSVVRAFVDTTLVPTLILPNSPLSSWTDSVAAAGPLSYNPRNGFLLVVLDPAMHIRGQFAVGQAEFGDAALIVRKLSGFMGTR